LVKRFLFPLIIFVRKYNDVVKLRGELWVKMERQLQPKHTQAMKLQDFSIWLAEFEQGDQTSLEVRLLNTFQKRR